MSPVFFADLHHDETKKFERSSTHEIDTRCQRVGQIKFVLSAVKGGKPKCTTPTCTDTR